jgi:hypothetical protein
VGSASHLPLQNDQLMSEHRILRLKPNLRLERRGQHGQNKTDQRDHRANLAVSSPNKPGSGFRHTHPLWGQKLKSSRRSSGVFLLKKLNFLRVNEAHRSAATMS